MERLALWNAAFPDRDKALGYVRHIRCRKGEIVDFERDIKDYERKISEAKETLEDLVSEVGHVRVKLVRTKWYCGRSEELVNKEGDAEDVTFAEHIDSASESEDSSESEEETGASDGQWTSGDETSESEEEEEEEEEEVEEEEVEEEEVEEEEVEGEKVEDEKVEEEEEDEKKDVEAAETGEDGGAKRVKVSE